jgi:hypothetical protein
MDNQMYFLQIKIIKFQTRTSHSSLNRKFVFLNWNHDPWLMTLNGCQKYEEEKAWMKMWKGDEWQKVEL